ncbi:MAG: rod shape-determining protein MreC [Deltaproteobacteria bacterium]|nr:rod shape-determining protein MreC [Deltaproteobacteria bacterium]
MRRGARRYRSVAIIAVLLLLPFVFLYVAARGRESSGRLGRAVQRVTGPVQSAATSLQRSAADALDRYLFLRGAADENERLKQRLGELQLELQVLQEQARQNERLQRQLKLAEQVPGARLVSARVIAFGTSPSYRTLRIDRGTADGVQRRAAVVTPDGVVGRVIAASSGYAEVLLIVDAGSRLDVVSARSRARGVLRGGIGSACRIEAMDRTVDVEPGDLMLTSGLDGAIAAGIPVGLVTVVDRRPTGLYLDAVVEPFVPFARLEEVLVLIEAPAELSWPEVAAPGARVADRAIEVEPGPESAPATQRAPEPGRGPSSRPTAVATSQLATPRPEAASQPATRAAATAPAASAPASLAASAPRAASPPAVHRAAASAPRPAAAVPATAASLPAQPTSRGARSAPGLTP